MSHMSRGIAALIGAGVVALVQYFLPRPWRFMITSAELIAVAVFLNILWGKTRDLAQTTEEHQARLDAIAGFAEKAQVVHDANRIVDSITATLYVHEEQDRVG